MSYIDSRRGPSFASMAAVVAIHGAVGLALVFGLTVAGVIKPEIPDVDTFDVRRPPPPPEPPKAQPEPKSAPDRKVYTPTPPLPLPVPRPPVDSTDLFPKPVPTIQPGTGGEGLQPLPTAKPGFTPVTAKPRNNPQGWVTTDDYRSNWIRQEMTGRARFRLEIAADGRVTGCEVTASTGHSELDAATCALISKRARFQPGRGSEGEAVPSSYSGTIDWQLPE